MILLGTNNKNLTNTKYVQIIFNYHLESSNGT